MPSSSTTLSTRNPWYNDRLRIRFLTELTHFRAEEILESTSKSQKTRIQPPDEYNAVIAGLSGAIGTSISNIAVYPIDLIVKRLQVQRAIQNANPNGSSKTGGDELYTDFVDAAKRIYKEEGGIGAFYYGCFQDTANSMCSAFLYFLSYNFLRQKRLQANISPSGKPPKTLGVFEELSVGVLAGAMAKFFTAPIANVVTRKQTAALRAKRGSESSKEIKSDVKSILQDIYDEKGVKGFWSGYDATLILTLNPAITFFLYETFKSLLPRKYRDKPTSGQTFILAAISKAMASSIMYPISMAKARSQVQQGKKKQTGGGFAIFETLKEAYKTGGVAGLYEGVSGEIMKGFFSNGITMLIKEALHRQILSLYFLIVRLRHGNKSLTDVVTDAAEDMYKRNTTGEQRETVQNIVVASQEKAQAAKSMVQQAAETATGKIEDTISLTKSQIQKAVETGASKASEISTDAKNSLSQIIDPEMSHIGDVSGEVGGIDWEDPISPSSIPPKDVKE